MSDGRLYQLYEFRNIDGTKSASPGSTQGGKFLKWNNTDTVFDYSLIGEGDIDTTYFTTFVTNVFNDELTTDNYLTSISKVGSYGQFNRVSGSALYLQLGELAWLDDVPAEKSGLTLPGNTKVLFDDNDNIGGEDAFTYNKTLNRLNFEGTSLMFDLTGGTEGTSKEGLKYLGNNSWSVGQSTNSTNAGSYNFFGGYRAGASFGSGSTRNVVIGTEAGYLAANNLAGSIFIGAFAGKYATSSNKFYLDNVDYTSTALAQACSFLYADLDSERRLYIRDRLSVEKEGKFGYSGLIDASGEYGMYQMSATSGGSPQWHDGTVWQDFANSTDTYLNDYDLTDSDLTLILSDLSEVGPIDLSSINTTVFATSPSSPETGKVTSDYGYIQISNSSFTDNEGLTYKAGFNYNNTTSELNVPGAVKLSTTASDTLLSDGAVWQDDSHGYIKLGGTSYQIDNEASSADLIDGVNLGSGYFEVFKQRIDNNLEFRTIATIPFNTSNNLYDRLTIIESSTDSNNVIRFGTTAELNYLETTIGSTDDRRLDRPKDDEMLPLRALRQGSNIVLTQTDEYITVDAVTGGAATLMTPRNLGTYNIYDETSSGTNIDLFGITSSDSTIQLSQGTNDIDLSLNVTIQGANLNLVSTPYPSGNYAGIYEGMSGATGVSRVLNFKRLVCTDGSVILNENSDDIVISSGSAAATGANIGSGAMSVYKIGTAPDFKFRTISDSTRHMDVTYNGDMLEFDVDDISWTDTASAGTDVFLIAQDATDSFVFTQRSLQGSNGIEIQDNATVNIDFTKEIPKFSFITTPVFTAGTVTTATGDNGLLQFKTNYDSDIRSTESLTANTMFQVNIGAGLGYDSVNNTLYSTTSDSGSGTDNYLAEITTDFTNSYYDDVDDVKAGLYQTHSFIVKDALGNILDTQYLYTPDRSLLGADYTDVTGATGDLGGIKILDKEVVWTNSTQRHLTLDELTGKTSIEQELVTYDIQNNKYDVSNSSAINIKRQQARYNIGSAYINGTSTENFYCNNSIISESLTATSTVDTHSIGDLTIVDKTITGKNTGSTTIRSTEDTGYGEGAKVIISSGDITLKLGNVPTASKILIQDSSGTSLFKIDDSGNVYIKGNLYVDQDIEAFSDDTDTF